MKNKKNDFKALGLFNNFTSKLIFILVILLLILSLLQVFFRYILNFSISWTEELSRYIFIWMVFLSGFFTVQEKLNIRLDIIINLFTSSHRKWLNICIDIFTAMFLLSIFIFGVKYSIFSMEQRTPALNIPKGYIYMALPIGSLLMFISIIRILKTNITKDKFEIKKRRH